MDPCYSLQVGINFKVPCYFFLDLRYICSLCYLPKAVIFLTCPHHVARKTCVASLWPPPAIRDLPPTTAKTEDVYLVGGTRIFLLFLV